MSTPDVFLHLDYHRYLDAWLNHEPAEGRREVGVFARRAACSLSQVSNVRYGTRNLDKAQIAGFCFAMGFTTEEAIYYAAIVRLTDAKTEEERAGARATVEQLSVAHHMAGPRPGPDRPLSCPIPALAPDAENLGLWQIPVLRALAACPGAPEALSTRIARIRPPVEATPASAQNPGSAIARVSLAGEGLSAPTLLQQGLGAARWALYQVPRAQRSFWSSYWCLRERDLDALRAAALVHDDRMAALFAEVAAERGDPPNIVYQWAVQIVPISRPVPATEPGEAPFQPFSPRRPLDIPPPPPAPIPALPSVFDALDYRTHLERWFAAKRALNPSYTVSRFARRAQCSQTHVEAVIRKNRDLHAPQVQGFARAMGLNDEESAFWAARVAADQATSASQKAQLLQRLAGFARFHNAQPLLGAALQCASSALHIATFEMGFAGDFQASPEWVSQALGVPEPSAAIALQDLAACRLLQQDKRGRWRPSVAVMSQAMAEAEPVRILTEEQGLEVAQAALVGDARSRHASALFGALPANALPRLREESLGIRRELDELASALQTRALQGDRPPERVYIVQTQLLPVSEQVDLPPVSTKERRASLRLPRGGIS